MFALFADSLTNSGYQRVIWHVRIAAAERFAERDGKPQGSRCIFNEMALPKGGWNQSWDEPAKLW